MDAAVTLRFSTQAQSDIARMTQQLSDLQRQVASGAKADDLRGFGAGAAQLLNAQTLKATSDSRTSVISELQARFGVQQTALGQVADMATMLSQSISQALSSNDGRGIDTDLQIAFANTTSALNETWNGQPLFAGERQGAGPIKVTSLDQLVAAAGPSDIYQEAARPQQIDLGTGTPITLAPKASELSQGMFAAMKQLKQLLDANGGQIGQPIDPAVQTQLQTLAATLNKQANVFTSAEGASGQLQTRFESEATRLQQRSDLLTTEIGNQKDADIAQVSVQLNLLTTQYQAAAKTFSDLSKLTLLDYL
jgi:flagellar hook-associated protein 3 FlgL